MEGIIYRISCCTAKFSKILCRGSFTIGLGTYVHLQQSKDPLHRILLCVKKFP